MTDRPTSSSGPDDIDDLGAGPTRAVRRTPRRTASGSISETQAVRINAATAPKAIAL